MPVSTFSIVAADRAAGEWGGAVASRFLAVGAVVLYARAGLGVVATQSYANTDYGPQGLDLLAQGLSASRVLDVLTSADEGRAKRQAGIVDREGTAATYTGTECVPWAGGVTGPAFAAQGNMLVGPEPVTAMARTFAPTPGSLARRLYAALLAGDKAGGDKRGRQAAALLVCREGGGYGGRGDRYLDLRVDDHPDPVTELGRLLELHELCFPPAGGVEPVPVDPALARQVQVWLGRLGYWRDPPDEIWSDALAKRLLEYLEAQNLEMRHVEGRFLDRRVLAYLRRHAESEGDLSPG